MNNSKSKRHPEKNILELFWKLSDQDSTIRINACVDILNVLSQKQLMEENKDEFEKDMQYCIERLLKGLASPRDAARLGYTLLLTEILKRFNFVSIEEILELIKKHLSITGKQEKRDLVFGQLFAYTAIIRSKRLPNHAFLCEVITSLFDLSCSRSYILNAVYEIFLDIFSQLSTEHFKNVWSCLKKKLPSDFETLSAQTMWLLLLCIRFFSNTISSKYMDKHWGKDLFSSENMDYLKKIIKQTTSCLPNLHPTCIEFILFTKERPDFQEIWNILIDDNLFIEHNEKSFVGFEMIKFALEDSPTEEIVEIVLSPKFRNTFSKSFLGTKHPLNPAASSLADYLCSFVKNKNNPNMQIIVLKAFLQPPGTLLLDSITKKNEVSLIIQNLLPDAVKKLCNILKTVLLQKKSDKDSDKEVNNMKRFQAIQQLSSLIAHPAVLTDIEWRIDTVQFLFLHSFFSVKQTNVEIPHCKEIFEPLSDALREACMTAFYKAVNLLHVRTEKQQSSLNRFVDLLLKLIEYAEILMNSTENVEPKFSIEKVQNSWIQLKKIVHKLKKKSKDNLIAESNAFLVLFLQLGLVLFQDPDEMADVLEELDICCKKSLKSHKNEVYIENETEPLWIGVIIDILLSLLSKSSKYFRDLVTYIFPQFCPFIDQTALQQILDIINPNKSSEDMLVDENNSEAEDEQALDFGSGSSSEEVSEDEAGDQFIDEEFKKKVRDALGPAAEESEGESIVLSDTEMFKLDAALSDAFKNRAKSGHTQIKFEDKTLLQFRLRCLDLILVYLRSEPPMQLVLMCLEPILSVFKFAHQSKHQVALLHKAEAILQFMSRIKKFQHHDNVNKSELERLLDILIPKCHKEINLSTSRKLSVSCVFIVLCYRKLKNADSPKKEKDEVPFYIKIYLTALEAFVSSGSSHMMPHFFTCLMEACPDVAWYFTDPCKNYAFNNKVRLFKRTQCLGLLSESLKYSKSQKNITDDQWFEFSNSVFPFAVESLKSALEDTQIKPAYCIELLITIYTLHSIIKEKTNESVLEKYNELLPLLTSKNAQKLKEKTNIKSKVISILRGNVNNCKKSKIGTQIVEHSSGTKGKVIDRNTVTDSVNDDLQSGDKKRRRRRRNSSSSEISLSDIDSYENCRTVNNYRKCKIGGQYVEHSSRTRGRVLERDRIVDFLNDDLQSRGKKKRRKRNSSSSEISLSDIDSYEKDVNSIEKLSESNKTQQLPIIETKLSNQEENIICVDDDLQSKNEKKGKSISKINCVHYGDSSEDDEIIVVDTDSDISNDKSGEMDQPIKKKEKSKELNEDIVNCVSDDFQNNSSKKLKINKRRDSSDEIYVSDSAS